MSGGFSAKYGRSDGGVISQVGKRGTNEWHFGGQVVWQPRFLQSNPKNLYYPVQPLPQGQFDCYDPTASSCINGKEQYSNESTYAPGTIHNYNKDNKSWETIYSAYVGGPLIKDKLYIFAAAELTKGQSTSVSNNTYFPPTSTPYLGVVSYSGSHTTKYYGKIDWNINDNNILEYTYLKSNSSSGSGATYKFNYDTLKSGPFHAVNNKNINNAQFNILHYTSYLSDNATLSVLWGKGEFANPVVYGNKSTLPRVQGNIDPSMRFRRVATTTTRPTRPRSLRMRRCVPRVCVSTSTTSWVTTTWVSVSTTCTTPRTTRSFVYTGGEAPAQVSRALGPDVLHGTRWIYYNASTLGGYAVRYLNIAFQASMSTAQKAYYLQDVWQATPNLQLNLGLRNDHYINYNNVGTAFVDMKNQWEPRLGFSWDVNGDSSFKVFGNAGRYYLALPTNAAERAATASVYVSQYFAYSGVNPDGTPVLTNCTSTTTANTAIDDTGNCAITSLSSPDGETGTPKDPKQVTATNLRPMYIDQFNFGFDKKLGDKWVYGAKASYRDLKTTIDDECDPYTIAKKMGLIQTNEAYERGLLRHPGDALRRIAAAVLPTAAWSIRVRPATCWSKNANTGNYTTVPHEPVGLGLPEEAEAYLRGSEPVLGASVRRYLVRPDRLHLHQRHGQHGGPGASGLRSERRVQDRGLGFLAAHAGCRTASC